MVEFELPARDHYRRNAAAWRSSLVADDEPRRFIGAIRRPDEDFRSTYRQMRVHSPRFQAETGHNRAPAW